LHAKKPHPPLSFRLKAFVLPPANEQHLCYYMRACPPRPTTNLGLYLEVRLINSFTTRAATCNPSKPNKSVVGGAVALHLPSPTRKHSSPQPFSHIVTASIQKSNCGVVCKRADQISLGMYGGVEAATPPRRSILPRSINTKCPEGYPLRHIFAGLTSECPKSIS
jgi:hypothetical protein